MALEGAAPFVSAVEPCLQGLVDQVLAAARTGGLEDAGGSGTGPGGRRRLLVAPLAVGDARLGVLVAGRGDDAAVFDDGDADLVGGFAGQAALALQLARSSADRERLTLLEDRDRIARDLHDLVIQRLFATGLSLQGLEARLVDEVARERVARAVDDLDDTVREIRRAIFSLRQDAPRTAEPGLRAALHEVVEAARQAHGRAAVLRVDGPVDTVVPSVLVPDVRAVVTEGLSNAARHAQASSVVVSVDTDGARLRVEVSDDGRGFSDPDRRSGLANLATRAEQRGGTFEVDSALDRGTRLVWTVPLS